MEKSILTHENMRIKEGITKNKKECRSMKPSGKMIGYNRANMESNMVIFVQMVNKTILLIINLLICFGSLLSHLQRQYDIVIKKNFFLTN